MKNIYNDKNIPSQPKPPSNTAAATPQESSNQAPQPVYFQQPPYGQPVYYIPVPQPPYGQPGTPYTPVPLTQEQLNAIYGQYGAPPFMPPQYPQPATENDNPQVDSGMRVLYQSEDFDSPSHEDDEAEDSYESYELPSEKPSKAFPKQPVPVKSPPDDDIEIEEETVSLPTAAAVQKKPTLKIEEMEMSTYELNSILLRQGRVSPHTQHPIPQKSKDVPVSFDESLEIEDTADEEVVDISSNVGEKKEKTSTYEIIRRVILAVALVAIVISAAMLINEYRLSSENDKLEEGVSDLIITEPTTANKNDKETTKKNNKNNKDKTTTAPLTPEQQWAQIQKEYPNIIFPMGLQLKYARLYATNPDFVGYLEAKGVGLSLPVVQTDNDSDYLEKNFYKKSTKYGCPFVTHVNNIVDLDMNTIIFGHHMNNGTVFGALDEYKSIDGFKAAPLITFNTLYQDYSWKVVAAFVTNAYEKDDNGYIFRYYFASLSTQDRFAAYLNEMSQRSLYDTGVDVLPTDKLLTLSTCSHEFEDARFVVVARLVRPGESTEVDVSKATVNPSPRYPQAFYDKKKLDNPYVNASRWEVG